MSQSLVFRKDAASKYDLYQQSFNFTFQNGGVQTTFRYAADLGRIVPLGSMEMQRVSPVFIQLIKRSMINLNSLMTSQAISNHTVLSNAGGILSLTTGKYFKKFPDALDNTYMSWYKSVLKSFTSITRVGSFIEEDMFCSVEDIQLDLQNPRTDAPNDPILQARSNNDVRFILAETQMATLGFATSLYENFLANDSFESLVGLAMFFGLLMKTYVLPQTVEDNFEDIEKDILVSQHKTEFHRLEISTISSLEALFTAPQTPETSRNNPNNPQILEDSKLSIVDFENKLLEYYGLTKPSWVEKNTQDQFTTFLDKSGLRDWLTNRVKYGTLASCLNVGIEKNIKAYEDFGYISMSKLIKDMDSKIFTNFSMLTGLMIFKNTRIKPHSLDNFLRSFKFLRRIEEDKVPEHLYQYYDDQQAKQEYNQILELLFGRDKAQRTRFRNAALNLLLEIINSIYVNIMVNCENSFAAIENSNTATSLPNASFLTKFYNSQEPKNSKILSCGFIKIGTNKILTLDEVRQKKNDLQTKISEKFDLKTIKDLIEQPKIYANPNIPFFRDFVYICVFDLPYQRVWGGSSNNMIDQNMAIIYGGTPKDRIPQLKAKLDSQINNEKLQASFKSQYTAYGKYAYDFSDAEKMYQSLPEKLKGNSSNVVNFVLGLQDWMVKNQNSNNTNFKIMKSFFGSDLKSAKDTFDSLKTKYNSFLDTYNDALTRRNENRKTRQNLIERLESETNPPDSNLKTKLVNQINELDDGLVELELSLSDSFYQLSQLHKMLGLGSIKNVTAPKNYLALNGTRNKYSLGFFAQALTVEEICSIAVSTILVLVACICVIKLVWEICDTFLSSNVQKLQAITMEQLELAEHYCKKASKTKDPHDEELCDIAKEIVKKSAEQLNKAEEKQAESDDLSQATVKTIKWIGGAVGVGVILYTLGKIYKDIKATHMADKHEELEREINRLRAINQEKNLQQLSLDQEIESDEESEENLESELLENPYKQKSPRKKKKS